MESIEFRAMREEDLGAVLAIEQDSFPSPWGILMFRGELKSAVSFPMVAVDKGGVVIGYICPMLVLDEGHILNVAVRPDQRGKGIGKMMVQEVLQCFRSRGASFVSLEVRPSNLVAAALYFEMGFREVGRRKRYYENGEDAILMDYIIKDDNKGEC